MAPFSRSLSLVALCSCAFAGCSGERSSADADLTGLEDSVGSKWQWAEVPIEVHAAGTNTTSKPKADPAVTARIQFWLDAIDERVREKMRAEHPDSPLENIPKPKAYLIRDRPDAFSYLVPVCYDVPVVASKDAEPDPGAALAAAKLAMDRLADKPGLPKKGNVEPFPSSKPWDCAVRHVDAREVDNLVAFINEHLSTCQVSRADDPQQPSGSKIVLGPSCQLASDPSSATFAKAGAKRLQIYATSNWITVTTELIAQYEKEEQLVWVLAHELGHYYRAHLFAQRGQYEFYYSSKEHPVGTLPAPPSDAAMKELLSQIAGTINTDGRTLDGVTTVDGQRIQSALIPGTIELSGMMQAKNACGSDASCKEACGALFGMLSSSDLEGDPDLLTGYFHSPFPKGALPSSELAPYRAYEQAFFACADAVPVTDGAAAGEPGLTAGQVLFAFSRLGTVGTTFQAAKNVGASVRSMNADVLAATANVDKAYTDAKAASFGYYTREQEADDLSAVHLDLLGMPPATAVDAALTDGIRFEEDQGAPMPPVTSAKECLALAEKGWQGVDYIQVGKLSDPHHSVCYRAFNMARFVEALGLDGHAHPRVAPPSSPTWAEILTKLQ